MFKKKIHLSFLSLTIYKSRILEFGASCADKEGHYSPTHLSHNSAQRCEFSLKVKTARRHHFASAVLITLQSSVQRSLLTVNARVNIYTLDTIYLGH